MKSRDKPKLKEGKEQELVFGWAHGPWDTDKKCRIFQLAPCIEEGYPEAQWLFAIMNGAWLQPGQGVFAKRRGLLSGVFDVMLPVTIPWGDVCIPGLFIELKAEGGSISQDQSHFSKHLLSQGYATRIEWGHKNVIREIKRYLKLRAQLQAGSTTRQRLSIGS